jgi:hypothetical protein
MDISDSSKKPSGPRPDTFQTQAPPCTPISPSAELTSDALRLIAALEMRVVLRELPAKFPNVLNRVAQVWKDANRADVLFDGLLFDTRGGRQGFSLEAVTELTRLREFHRQMFPRKTDVWSEVLLR